MNQPASNTTDTTARIRELLARHGQLNTDAATLPEDADLYQAGMNSHASVNLMLALEGGFDVEFPDHLLTRSVFSSIASIRAAIDGLKAV